MMLYSCRVIKPLLVGPAYWLWVNHYKKYWFLQFFTVSFNWTSFNCTYLTIHLEYLWIYDEKSCMVVPSSTLSFIIWGKRWCQGLFRSTSVKANKKVCVLRIFFWGRQDVRLVHCNFRTFRTKDFITLKICFLRKKG